MRTKNWLLFNGNKFEDPPENIKPFIQDFKKELSKSEKMNDSYISVYEENDSYFLVLDCRIIVNYNAEDMEEVKEKAEIFENKVEDSNNFTVHDIEDVTHNGFIKVNIETKIENSNSKSATQEFSNLYKLLEKKDFN